MHQVSALRVNFGAQTTVTRRLLSEKSWHAQLIAWQNKEDLQDLESGSLLANSEKWRDDRWAESPLVNWAYLKTRAIGVMFFVAFLSPRGPCLPEINLSSSEGGGRHVDQRGSTWLWRVPRGNTTMSRKVCLLIPPPTDRKRDSSRTEVRNGPRGEREKLRVFWVYSEEKKKKMASGIMMSLMTSKRREVTLRNPGDGRMNPDLWIVNPGSRIPVTSLFRILSGYQKQVKSTTRLFHASKSTRNTVLTSYNPKGRTSWAQWAFSKKRG